MLASDATRATDRETAAIEIRGLPPSSQLRQRVQRRLDEVLLGLTVKPVVGTAVFVGDNGPRGGGVRCALTLRLPYRPALRAERTATTPRLAFDGAFAVLERQFETYRARQRDRRRRRKKYYVAKRLLT
jgi:ribosome-associated translation inhibitor RaiA